MNLAFRALGTCHRAQFGRVSASWAADAAAGGLARIVLARKAVCARTKSCCSCDGAFGARDTHLRARVSSELPGGAIGTRSLKGGRCHFACHTCSARGCTICRPRTQLARCTWNSTHGGVLLLLVGSPSGVSVLFAGIVASRRAFGSWHRSRASVRPLPLASKSYEVGLPVWPP